MRRHLHTSDTMQHGLLAAVLLVGSCTVATATSDSWVSLRYPLADLQVDDANCEAQSIVLDTVSSGAHSRAKLIIGLLTQPIEVPAPVSAGAKTADANAITDQAKGEIQGRFEIEEDSGTTVRGRLIVDVKRLNDANGPAREGREDTVKRVKKLIAFSLANFFRAHDKAAISVTIEGLPSQDDLSGTKLPAALQSPVSPASPWLRALQAELKPTRHCPRF